MIQIKKPLQKDISALTVLARETLVQSHGHSAPEKDIEAYLNRNYTEAEIEKELNNDQNIYRLLYYNNLLIGFSKMIYNQRIDTISQENITKLERIYILEEYHGLGIAKELFDFNIALAKDNNQVGIWLFTWTENKRAIGFYEKMGFVIVGEHDFRISETHSNPNWQYYLAF